MTASPSNSSAWNDTNFRNEQRDRLERGAQELGVSLDTPTLDRFLHFAELMAEANTRLNLTRIAPEDVVALHFLDSLALAAVAPPAPRLRLLDVGTGAGLPGVPLALAFPTLDITLLDGTRKRLRFLDEAIAALPLPNARTLHGRAEEIARLPAHHERYDLVTARAVAKMETLAAWLLPLTRPGGLAVAYKSRDAAEEIEAARPRIAALGGQIERIADVALPFTDITRKLVLLRKNEITRHTRRRV